MARRVGWWVLVAQLCGQLVACQRELSPAERGQRIFLRNCASCHGPEAKGGPRPGFVVAPRDLTRPEFQASVSDVQLSQIVRQGKGQMPGFGVLLSDADVAHVSLHLRSLTGSPGSTP